MSPNRKMIIVLLIETVVPWLVLVGGIPAMYFYMCGPIEKLKFFYEFAMLTGRVAMVAEFIIGTVSFVLMIVSAFCKEREKNSIIYTGLIWFYSGWCILGSGLLMFLVEIFTYGQSI